MKKQLFTLICFMATAGFTQAQIVKPKKILERKAESRANSRVDQSVDKGLDKIEEGIGSIFKKKTKKQKQETTTTENTENSNNSSSNAGDPKSAETKSPAFKTYSKFDFVPGDKVLAYDDFSQTSLGDFPAGWNTNGSAEIVNLEGRPEKWLFMSSSGSYLPEYVTDMPENFTLEFDVFTRYSSSNILAYGFIISAENDARKQMADAQPENGIHFGWDGGGIRARYAVYENDKVVNKNDGLNIAAFDCKGQNNDEPSLVKVSIWRQKNRLKIYANETKVLDIPQAFAPGKKYNSFKFGSTYMNFSIRENKDEFMVSNIRYAVGAPDTRSKLITEGKFVTRGILFDVNSDKIKGTSYGAMKEIAGVLNENSGVKVNIVGYTDSDGDDNSNLVLSQKRAAAVKTMLSSEFGVAADRMTTDGKGEANPTDSNTTPEGKANNRRVEFIKN